MNSKHVFVFVFLVAAFFLAVPVFLRFQNGGFFIGESYKYLKPGGSGSFGLFISFFAGLGVSLRAVQFFLGLLSFALFYLLLRQLGLSSLFFSCLVLALSPLFVYSFNVLTPFCLIIPLVLLSFYLLLSLPLLSSLSLALLALVSPAALVFVLFVVLSAFLVARKKYLYFVFLHICAFIFFILLMVSARKFFLYFPLSDLGYLVGFGLFNVVLAVVGFVVLWKKRSFLASYSALFVLALAQVAGFDVLPYLLFVLSFFAGHGFYWLYRHGWRLNLVKQLTLLLIVCGLVFSGVSYSTRLSKEPPDRAVVDALLWLRGSSARGSVVLSHESNRYFVEYFSGRYFTSANSSLFYSRNLDTARNLLGYYGVDYIFITPEMRQGLVWGRADEGLLFLFRNRETFENVYKKDGVELWRVLG